MFGGVIIDVHHHDYPSLLSSVGEEMN